MTTPITQHTHQTAQQTLTERIAQTTPTGMPGPHTTATIITYSGHYDDPTSTFACPNGHTTTQSLRSALRSTNKPCPQCQPPQDHITAGWLTPYKKSQLICVPTTLGLDLTPPRHISTPAAIATRNATHRPKPCHKPLSHRKRTINNGCDCTARLTLNATPPHLGDFINHPGFARLITHAEKALRDATGQTRTETTLTPATTSVWASPTTADIHQHISEALFNYATTSTLETLERHAERLAPNKRLDNQTHSWAEALRRYAYTTTPTAMQRTTAAATKLAMTARLAAIDTAINATT